MSGDVVLQKAILGRREFLAGAAGALPAALWSHHAVGETSKRPLIVYLGTGTTKNASRYIDAFRDGLKELGLLDGDKIQIVIHLAENRVERMPALAEQSVALSPNLIAAGSSDAAVFVKRFTSKIPILSGALADAERLGLVDTYSRPGGNVTGITPYVSGSPSKQIEIAREIVPGVTKLGILGNMYDPKAQPQRDELKETATKLGISVAVPDLNSPDDIDGALRALSDEKVDVVIVLETAFLLSLRDQIATFMSANRIPAVYGYREHVEVGGLINYGVDLVWCWHRAAALARKILSGSSPAGLPVEFPTRIQMAVNLKAAKILGVTLPSAVIARADVLIE